MEEQLRIELEGWRNRSLSYNISIEEISKHLDFVPKLKPKRANKEPSPMRLNKKDKKVKKKPQIKHYSDNKTIFLEDEYIKSAKIETYFSFQEDEEIESDSTGEMYPNKYFRNELQNIKEFTEKTENVFPKIETAICPFKKSRLSKLIVKDFLNEDEQLEVVKRTFSITSNQNKESIVSPMARRSSSILNFLEKRKSSDYELLK